MLYKYMHICTYTYINIYSKKMMTQIKELVMRDKEKAEDKKPEVKQCNCIFIKNITNKNKMLFISTLLFF